MEYLPKTVIDFKWVSLEGIKPLNTAVFVLPKEQQIKNKVGLKKNSALVAFHCHKKAATYASAAYTHTLQSRVALVSKA